MFSVSLLWAQGDILSEAKVAYVQKDYSQALQKFEIYAKKHRDDFMVKEYIKLCKDNIAWQKERQGRFVELAKKERAHLIKATNISQEHVVDNLGVINPKIIAFSKKTCSFWGKSTKRFLISPL